MVTSETQALFGRIHWLGHSSFRIGGANDSPLIYIDPWRLKEDEPPADVILVSHDHHDHCSPADIVQVRTLDTLVIANPPAARVIGLDVTVVRVWQSVPIAEGITLRAVPAYTPQNALHSKKVGGLGFVLEFADHTLLYFAGDTGFIPEMERIRCDIAIVPVDDTQTMSPDEAAQVVRKIRPQIAIPMHYGSGGAGTPFNGNRFCDLVKPPVEAVLLPNEGKAVPSTGPLGLG